ncbi:NAD-dependent epimerase/dehydratase family protein [Microbaculum marinum]|uniref:NAD-dependent epimerase/dehydratase family protein n=1 Tax=Microbaculum marinum TaxID=1764581 RepID=A0AAW9RLN7_9HYPH
MHHFISGMAGFIGSHLADSLLRAGHKVSGADDLSLGRLEHLENAHRNPGFRFFEADCSQREAAIQTLRAAAEWGGRPHMIWHMAANSDIAAGVSDPTVDFSRTLMTTFSVLEAARDLGVRCVAFASTSAVYGERAGQLEEDSGPLLPISNYGAAKLAGEALLSAAAEAWLDRIWICRFPNVVGHRATHGAIFDFISRLKMSPVELRVLGDGTQTKPYLHVSDLISAMEFVVANAQGRRNVFNIAPEGEGTSVAFIAKQTVARVAPGAAIRYEGGDRGWIGDVPKFRFSTARLAGLGWRPSLSSDAAVLRAIDELSAAALGQQRSDVLV